MGVGDSTSRDNLHMSLSLLVGGGGRRLEQPAFSEPASVELCSRKPTYVPTALVVSLYVVVSTALATLQPQPPQLRLIGVFKDHLRVT